MNGEENCQTLSRSVESVDVTICTCSDCLVGDVLTTSFIGAVDRFSFQDDRVALECLAASGKLMESPKMERGLELSNREERASMFGQHTS